MSSTDFAAAMHALVTSPGESAQNLPAIADGLLASIADYEATTKASRLRQRLADSERRLREHLQIPPENEPERVWVLAGNRAEYAAWCLDHNLHPGDRRAIELHAAWQLQGVERGLPYVRTGTWQRRRDLPAIGAALASREARQLSEVTPWGCRTTDGPAHHPTRTGTAKPSS